ncbi:MAG: hypothetical protein JXR64_04720 [Spirochaetales bacterium]|nr:hypothetical protein [Spirochaetales bacterium]
MDINLFIIDSLSPFFSPLEKNMEYNWSKVPFNFLEENNLLKPEYKDTILNAFESYLVKVKNLGYNAITIDELCRMVIFNFYSIKIKKKLESYIDLYREIFKLVKNNNIKIYITTDIMFYNNDIKNFIGKRNKNKATSFLLKLAIRQLFNEFPEVDGVIFRLGESDGVDVEGDFISSLFIKTPKQCRTLIRYLLPLFEDREKHMIIRSWTLGAYSIGDLMWNKDTVDKVFKNIESESLILSLKYGESDFFRYLNLNPLFYYGSIQKIIELQSRREYEGFGEFPSYIGSDYEKIYRYLQKANNLIGLSTWCQTGGWSHFTKLTFSQDSSIWTEINTYIIPQIFKGEFDSKQAVYNFADENLGVGNGQTLYKLLKLSQKIIRELWYIPEISSKRLYFRRSRIPTLLWNVWDNIIISHSLRRILKSLVLERKEAIIDGYRALSKIRKLKEYAYNIGIDTEQFDYMYDTFNIIAHGREYYLGKWNLKIQDKIVELSKEYKIKYPYGFHILIDFSLVQPRKWVIKTIFKLAIRTRPEYTLLDKLILIRLSSLIYILVNLKRKRKTKSSELLNEKAMGIQVFFK